MSAFFLSLTSFSKSRLQQLHLTKESLPDVPLEPFPDPFVLHDSNALSLAGRSSACQYHRTLGYDTFSDNAGNIWYAMRRTLATQDKVQKTWSCTSDASIERPSPGLAKKLQALFSARDVSSLMTSCRSAGCASASNLDLLALRRVLRWNIGFWTQKRGPLHHSGKPCV